ncbi:MAG: TetR/AcrR family transcriptional regulator C-terminal domain-containing protein [Clostridium sp.]
MSDTKRRLAMALKELLQEKPLKKITIQDIVERSHMTRQSFYYHFQDIYEVLELICQYELIDRIVYKEEESFSQWLEHLVELVEENRWFYRKLLLEVDWNRLSAKLKPPVERQVNRILNQYLPKEGLGELEPGRELLMDFLTSSIISYLFNYVSNKKKSEKQTMENLHKMLAVCTMLRIPPSETGDTCTIIANKAIQKKDKLTDKEKKRDIT